jgi:hypothetical protein
MGLLKRSQDRALSDVPKPGGSGCLIVFAAFFALFGSFFVAMFFVLPLWRVVQAQSWQEVPCTILESSVETKSDSDGSTYRVAVRFRYHVAADGAPREGYESTRYDLTDGQFSAGQDGKQTAVNALPPGTRVTCWVDPTHPSEAVLVRGVTSTMWFGSFTLLFPAVGIGIIVFALRQRKKEHLRRDGLLGLSDEATTPEVTVAVDQAGRQVLKPVATPLKKFFGLVIFAVLWNGFVWSILGFLLIPDMQRGRTEWFPLIFLGVFALIGLVVIGAAIRQGLALTNPRLCVIVNRSSCRPGEAWEISWECHGDPRRLRTLCLALEGIEEATYKRGTKTTTDTHVYRRLPVAAADDGRTIASGRATITIPEDAVPTFTAPNNTLHWRLIVRGEIPRWPDISDDYPVTILPPGAAS